VHATQLMRVEPEAAGAWLSAVMRNVNLPTNAAPGRVANFVRETYSTRQCATFLGKWVRHLRAEGACGSTLEQLMDSAALPDTNGEPKTAGATYGACFVTRGNGRMRAD